MKVQDNGRIKVEPDDTIKIQDVRGARELRGKVTSASDYGPGERFIEYEILPSGRYGYWQQPADGGFLVEVNGQEINELTTPTAGRYG